MKYSSEVWLPQAIRKLWRETARDVTWLGKYEDCCLKKFAPSPWGWRKIIDGGGGNTTLKISVFLWIQCYIKRYPCDNNFYNKADQIFDLLISCPTFWTARSIWCTGNLTKDVMSSIVKVVVGWKWRYWHVIICLKI